MKTFFNYDFIPCLFFLLFMELPNSYGDAKMSDIMTKMKAVKDKILNGYDKLIRPTKDGSNTTEVSTALIPRQILEVDEERGLFILDSYFLMTWEDSRLRWDPAVEGYSGWIPLPIDTLWLPELTVHNSHSMSVNPAQTVQLTINPTGKVFWVPPINTQTSCPQLLEKKYPYEDVECIIILSSWVHDGWEIDFSHGTEVHLDEFVDINPRWELVVSKTRVNRTVVFYEGYDEPFIFINAYFSIRRRPIPEIEATRSPCIIVMLLTLSTFWLPPNSEKKIFVLGFMLLVLNLLLIYVSWSTKFPMGVVFAGTFLQSTMYIVASAFLLQVLVIFNLCNLSGPTRPPPLAMQLLSGPFAKYFCLRWSSSNDVVPIDRIQLKEDSPGMIESPTPRDDWLLFAAGLDRLLFVIVSISMIAIHHL